MNISWEIDYIHTDYKKSVIFMEKINKEIISNNAQELIWMTFHNHIYTGGISAKKNDLLKSKIPVYETNRGGQYTYHGPNMRMIYLMLNIKNIFYPKRPDVSLFVQMLEEWIINILNHFSIKGEIRKDRVGIWVKTSKGEKKIAAIGIKIKKWVTYHGIAVNINPDLNYFNDIIPCGIKEFGVTSMYNLGIKITTEEFDEVAQKEFYKKFTQYFTIPN